MMRAHFIYGGPQRVITDRNGKRWDFEMHPHCGPIVTDRHGEIKDMQPGKTSPFWNAVKCWIDQGETLKGNVCQWEEPAPPTLIHLGRNNYAMAGSRLAEKHAALSAQAKGENK
jgi:hypothetical protein